ncbi:MAG: DNA gyrase subunit A [Alphaproteobacteria bacterium CG_4_10_14_0_2_um_filter_63_37]|nr:MAG: DNA gyrase subunit A [Proteobacteria bacterium CG1_02_64_396]PJA24385.1 MAG: DNA gyrase subunit A [Alphaproteobacteria bacterium CG_4_10_14_0_2_um_filter_63_37]
MLINSPPPVPVNLDEEMRRSYLDYAMSVIVGRALPDIRDGLKPVHRRILFAMKEMGNDYNKPYKKSARIVGDVIGKYHPHGDSAVYDAMVRLAQPFAMRYTMVEGQGNFGSVDGDSPAAMRYTEVRLDKLAHTLLEDLDKETVDFGDNYDGSLQEPKVLPAAFPHLLVNGSEGIAVGMATKIPPHNLTEVLGATIALIDDPEIDIAGLMKYVPAPDFPTGAFIYGRSGAKQAYETGRGSITMRAKIDIETDKKGTRQSIIISEIPYQLNKARLIEHMAELVKEKKLLGISELRDESDRDGMRIVLDLKRDAVGEIIINQLFKMTPLQSNFGIIMLAVDHGRPRLVNLKEALQAFIDHRREVITRRTIYELRKAEERAHLLEGLAVALQNIDEVIAIIKAAPSPAEARINLMEVEWRFNWEGEARTQKFTQPQAQAILEMRLHRLTGMEQEKLVNEYRELLNLINRLKEILASESELMGVIRAELVKVNEDFGDKRRTQIVDETAELTLEDLIAEEDMVVTMSLSGYIKRQPVTHYRSQRRGGKGRTAVNPKEGDVVERLFIASTHDTVMFFTNRGRVFWSKVYEIPQSGPTARGTALVNLHPLQEGERITATMPVRHFVEDRYVLMATRSGIVKKTDLMAYSNVRNGGVQAIKLGEGDSVIGVAITDGAREVLLTTSQGLSIRFPEEQARPMGRVSQGVRGIKLEKGDEVRSMDILAADCSILTVTTQGFGKRSKADDYRQQNRGGKGLITIKTTKRNGYVVGCLQVLADDEVMIITAGGTMIRIRMKDLRVIGRNTQGVTLFNIDEGDDVVAVVRVVERPEDDDDEGDDGVPPVAPGELPLDA